jgi:hypothetical protein
LEGFQYIGAVQLMDELMMTMANIRRKWEISGNLSHGGKISFKFIVPSGRALLSCSVTPPGSSLSKSATFLITDCEKLEEWFELISKKFW